ncbi:MAG: hypothetical protein KDK89_20150 [Alphaproteobacteria bacterium]|nr:hypothetical protein [Alphaproteobacteria bacterium]
MRNIVPGLGAVALWLLATPVQPLSGVSPGLQSQLPQWLELPTGADVTESGAGVQRDGGVNGYLTAAIAIDGEDLAAGLKTRLALQGFRIEDRTSDLDHATGAGAVFVASNPGNGRHLIAVVLDTPSGGLLRIDYQEPPAQATQSP